MARIRLYPHTTGSSGREINMRTELIKTLFGSGQEIAKGMQGLLRKMRRDSAGNLIKCPCVSTITGEPDKDIKCPVCFAEGFLWDETLFTFYKVELGGDGTLSQLQHQHTHSIIDTSTAVFYIPSTTVLTGQDKIVLLDLSTEGVPLSPLSRNSIYRINSLRDLRLDTAKLEFWKANCNEDTNKFL